MKTKPEQLINDDDKQKKICRYFRSGAKWLVARRIWIVVEESLNVAENSAIKTRLNINDCQQVDRLRDGTAAMDQYVCAMAEADVCFSETGESPAKDELAVSGYQATVLRLQTGHTAPQKTDVLLSETIIYAILLAHDSSHFKELAKSRDFDSFGDDDWKSIALEINKELKAYTGRSMKPHRLRDAFLRSAEAVFECREAIPYSWLLQVERDA